MTEQKRKYVTTSAFPEPNYTQTPNNFFDMISDMSEAELRVTSVMIRQTFGFHRESFKMGLRKLADASGLSRQGALNGAEAAEARGTFRRSNPDEQGEAEWELIVASTELTPSSQLIPPLYPVEAPPLVDRGHSPVKENIKKQKENNNDESLALLSKLYFENIGMATPLMADILRNASLTYPKEWYQPAFEIAVQNNARNWRYVETILQGWKDHEFGWKPEKVGKFQQPQKSTVSEYPTLNT